jgi:hypothetical protein
MISKAAKELLDNLSKEQKATVFATVCRFIDGSLKIELPPSEEEIDRALIEAAQMVRAGQITADDLRPAKHDITLTRQQRYHVYTTPTHES